MTITVFACFWRKTSNARVMM
ncbi:hypothetical protein CY0110_19817 [Crocosphaera chwakensis CCY0110]|uniref:Uncharacterized protein n=1 Tax=Crocosphaera chwakensis CCY0110 TaxID=391612 RepID=A3IJU5_9CHRO|nr:hypothetical protein CY0110_19817 [Crocosphaera chwakensis CCY0110]